MRLTLLRAKEALRPFSPADKLEYRINRCHERLLTNGKFAGSMERIRIRAPYGQLSLPRQYRTVEAVKVDGQSHEIGNLWYELLPGRCDCDGWNLQAVRDIGDGLATLEDLRLGGALYTSAPTVSLSGGGGTGARVSAQMSGDRIVDFTVDNGGSGYTTAPTVSMTGGNGDGAAATAIVSGGVVIDVRLVPSGTLTVVGGTATIYGKDEDFMPVTLEITNATTANPFMVIDRIHKEQGANTLEVYQLVYGLKVNLALMSGVEEETFYRRYLISTVSNKPSATVRALVKLRHLEFTDDADTLTISNLGALENGMNALQFEAENDKDTAEKYWATAIDILNRELFDTNAVGSIPGIRIIRGPRGTYTRFQGFM